MSESLKALKCFSVQSYLEDIRTNQYNGHIALENIDRLHAYIFWRRKLEEGLAINSYSGLVSIEALDYFKSLINAPQHILLMKGKAEMLEYTWPNKERKIMPVWYNSFIVQPDLAWLKYYPFIQPCDSGYSKILLNKEQLRAIPLCSDTYNIMLSHNDHFGHFLADNFPLLAFLSCSPLKNFISDCSIPVLGHRKSILSLFNILDIAHQPGVSSGPDNYNKHHKMVHNEKGFVCEIMSSSVPASIFLWTQIKTKIIPKLASCDISLNKTLKIWLVRGSGYESRVHNFDEVSEFLQSEGFIMLDPCTVSISELVKLLYAASYIVAEAGSTTLNAALFANPSCNVISLCSERFIASPSSGMIYGGLPYLLSFADQVRVVIGKVVRTASIESSDLCNYSISDIYSKLIGPF
jgi:hypothetical protein